MKSTIKAQVEEFLQKPKGIKKSYLRILAFYIIEIIGFSIFLGLTVDYGPFVSTHTINHDVVFSQYLFQNANLSNAVSIISIFAFCAMAFPFICLFSFWMIGINQVTKSPYFHFFLWITCAILMVLLIICIVLFARASVYNFAAIYH